MYCDYWNLTKPPFDNVPDASMYVDCHESMENVISETIFAIKEGNECLTVIVGDVGLGKTLSLRVIIDSLEPEKYKVALITNPALSFVQLLREIIGQITGKQCEVKSKVDLQEIFNQLLFEAADQGKKIVIIIDEANVLSSSNLDDLRLLTNMQDDERNLFTLLLVGQMEFARTLEHPKRANLFQRIGTYGHLEKLPSPEAAKTYIESRLKIAGTDKIIFDDDAIPVIWEFSEHGVPRLINKICKLCIKAGETNEFASISGEVAQQIADRFQKLSKTSVQKRKAITDEQPPEDSIKKREVEKIPKTPTPSIPKKEEAEIKPPVRFAAPPSMEEPMPVRPRMATPEPPPLRPTPPTIEEPISVRPRTVTPEQPPARRSIHPQMEEATPVQPRVVMPESPPVRPTPPPMEEPMPVRPRMATPEPPPLRPTPPPMDEPMPVGPRMATPEPPPLRPAPPPIEEPMPVRPRMVTPELPPARSAPPPMDEPMPVRPRMVRSEQPPVRPAPPPMDEPMPVRPRMVRSEQPPERPAPPPMDEPMPVRPQTVPVAKPSTNYVPTQGVSPSRTASNIPPQQEARPLETKQEEAQEQPVMVENEVYEDVLIGKQKIKLAIPAHVIKQAQSSNNENKNKLAGYWSAQILKGNPNLTHASVSDPVSMWFEVKNVILKKFNSPPNTNVKMTSS